MTEKNKDVAFGTMSFYCICKPYEKCSCPFDKLREETLGVCSFSDFKCSETFADANSVSKFCNKFKCSTFGRNTMVNLDIRKIENRIPCCMNTIKQIFLLTSEKIVSGTS